MTAKAGKPCLYEERTDDVSERQDCTVYRIGNETGAAVMTSYPVFPGIDLIYNDVHMQGRVITNARTDTVFEINHCSEGRVEYGLAGGFFYLAPGDLSVSVGADMGDSVYYPTGHYHGITVLVDTKKAPKCLSCFLDDVKVSPESLMERFTTDDKGFISRSDTGIEHVFSELYSVPEAIRKGYLKVKILELFLYLSALDFVGNETAERVITRKQSELAKSVCSYLEENMAERVTLDMLAKKFHMSGTSIKNSFKAVYGVSLYTFIRARKMRYAAKLLKDSTMSVLEIAGSVGYENGSKFAKAFRETMGVNPIEYRNTYH